MKLIHTDLFGGDYPNEKFVEGLLCTDRETLQRLADIINFAIFGGIHRHYKVVDDDYKLQPGFEP